jgi:exodeoxyribonuclease V alpha subunit
VKETILCGKVLAVVFKNEVTGYAVVRIAVPGGGKPVTAVGHLPHIAPGEGVTAEGYAGNHPTYGEQFFIEKAARTLPETPGDIKAYLASGVIRGVGKVTAQLIVDKFGADTLRVLEKEPEKLTKVRGINEAGAKRISSGFLRHMGLKLLLEFLASHGLDTRCAALLLRNYGSDARAKVRENPYILAHPDYGAEFHLVDAMALREGMARNSPLRCQAALLHQLHYNTEIGHSYLPRAKLLESTESLIDCRDDGALSGALDILCEKRQIAVGKSPGSGADICYLPELYQAETGVAEFIAQRSKAAPAPGPEIAKAIAQIEAEIGLSYAPAQREAIELAVLCPLFLLTGGPGTGKTTAVSGILRLMKRQNLRVSLAAPTGRAAKRMSELTGESATTLHRLLEFMPDPESGAFRFLRNEKNRLPADMVIVDEFSMVDVLLFERLLRALAPGARLVLVGDPDQLPSVGPGQVLADIISSDSVRSVHLREIFRQAGESAIVTSAHSVNMGVVPPLRNKDDSDFFFLRRTAPEEALRAITELCAERLPRRLGLEPSQIQIITPTRKGPFGTVALNKALQEALNPPSAEKAEKQYGDTTYRVGDRVMQTRNNYNLVWIQSGDGGVGVYNGETGVIESVDTRYETLTVRYDDHLVEYPFDILGELESAYAITVHKAQGSEYTAVILAIMNGPPPLLTRRVLYTAMTRARRWLIVVGDETVFARMTANTAQPKRYSALRERILPLRQTAAASEGAPPSEEGGKQVKLLSPASERMAQ